MRSRFAGAICAVLAIGFISSNPALAKLKTAKECYSEYVANKAQIQAAKQTRTDFLKQCRAQDEGTPAPVGAKATPGSTTAPAATASSRTPAPTGRSTGANQYTTADAAKARCPSDTVVWVNTASHVYHFPGTRYYGHTRSGAYMCEHDAVAASDRTSKTERHP